MNAITDEIAPHKHTYRPSIELGENNDGSAAIWTCNCGVTIRYEPEPPIIPRSNDP